MWKKEEEITRQDVWAFIQAHKDSSKDDFGGWLVGQSANPSDKIIKAICFWNEQKTGA